RSLSRVGGPRRLPERLRRPEAVGSGFVTAQRGGGMLVLRALGPLLGALRFLASARQFILANGEFQAEAGQFALHLGMAMHGGDGFAFCFALLFVDFRERLLR